MHSTVLYHCSHRSNVASILEQGLLLEKASNKKLPYVWFDTEPSYALRAHIADKKGWAVKDVVTFAVLFPACMRTKLIRHPLSITAFGEALKVRANIAPSCIKLLSEEEQGWL